MPKQRFKIAASVRHTQNQHILVLHAIHDDVFANWKASRAGAKIVVAGTAQIWMAGEKDKAAGD